MHDYAHPSPTTPSQVRLGGKILANATPQAGFAVIQGVMTTFFVNGIHLNASWGFVSKELTSAVLGKIGGLPSTNVTECYIKKNGGFTQWSISPAQFKTIQLTCSDDYPDLS